MKAKKCLINMCEECEHNKASRHQRCPFRSISNDYCDDYVNILKSLDILELIKKHPDELGFIAECENYSEYVNTFLDAELTLEDVAYTEEEFNILKEVLKDECND